VVLHVRKAQDQVLKALRQYPPHSGIAHAFNGSLQQAEQFLRLGLKLGFGGACTYSRALQLRRLVCGLPLEALVLETDGPDIPPAWVPVGKLGDLDGKRRSEPSHIAGIATCMAELRGCSLETLSLQTQKNARVALPRLGR
jgi:TatD DNase family protein